jgi:hypothetical protein
LSFKPYSGFASLAQRDLTSRIFLYDATDTENIAFWLFKNQGKSGIVYKDNDQMVVEPSDADLAILVTCPS